MKRERRNVTAIFRVEIRLASSAMRIVRRNLLIVGFFALALLAGRGVTEASLPFLRGGGRAAFAPALTKKPAEEKRRSHRNPILHNLGHVQRAVDALGGRMRSEAAKQWNGLGREWDKLASSVGKLVSTRERRGTQLLDDVVRSFRSVRSGDDLDAARLLTACRAHLELMKSGGAALRVVARDMESNLLKAEAPFRTLPLDNKGRSRSLASLLRSERESGAHDGSVLADRSAAMGLLWMRRSLDFQKDLYASLVPADGPHPKDAAMDAYRATLSPYHGWLLQKAFPVSLSQMPSREVFLAKFGGREVEDLDEEYEREIVDKLKSLIATWEPMIDVWRDEFERLDLEDTSRA